VLDTSIQAPTEIYFNEELHYMNGYKLTIEANGVDVSSSFTVERENGDAYL